MLDVNQNLQVVFFPWHTSIIIELPKMRFCANQVKDWS